MKNTTHARAAEKSNWIPLPRNPSSEKAVLLKVWSLAK